MRVEKTVRGLRFKRLDNGNVQVYAKKRNSWAHCIGDTHSAWRLAFELTPALIADLHLFINTTT